jgi:CIC family chloride channel protein
MFFSSLLLGALAGRLFATALDTAAVGTYFDPDLYALIGMSALSAAVIGGPCTMIFVALESTGNLWLAAAVLVAVIVSAQVTRKPSAIRSLPGAFTCAVRRSAAPPMSAGSATSRWAR